MQNEIFVPVKGYNGAYEVSNLGRVKSLKRVNRIILNPAIDKDGYYYFCLSMDGKTKKYKAHRLVAVAFIDNPNNKSCINHLNGIKSDNRVANLEWATVRENNIHAYAAGLKKIPLNHGSSKPVLQIDKLTNEIIKEYPSAREAYRQTGIGYTLISDVCRKRKNLSTAKGYKWKFKPIAN